MIQKMKNVNRTELRAGICVLLALFFMLFIYAPTELYCYNMDEFWFDMYELMPIMLIAFVGGFFVSSFVVVVACVFFPKLYHVIGLPVLCIVFLCTYVQGNFLVGNLPPMDGSIPDWSDYHTEMNQSIILWIVVTIVIFALCIVLRGEKFAKVVRVISVCMLLMFGVTTLSVLLMTEGYKPKSDAYCTVKDEYVFSEEENYIILVLDSIDAESFSAVLDEKPEYKEVFEDFTYYENMMGAYPCTGVAIPHILSGVWYENEKPFEEYEIESYNNSPILSVLEQEEYKLGMYEDEMPLKDKEVFRFSNVLSSEAKVSSYWDFARLELKLIGLRYLPFQLKSECVFNTINFISLWQKTNEEDYPLYRSENRPFYENLLASDITTVSDKCFKFIHIEGGHMPFRYDENVNLIGENDGTYRDSLKATLTITKAYLDKLKEAGVYDNSSIIIMTDHGYAEEYGFVEGVEACEWRQNPIFFAKAKNERHEMSVSQAPVSYADLQKAFVKLMAAESAGDIFEYQEDDERESRYIYYDFMEDEYMYEYISKGHASDDAAMIFTGNEYILEE